MKRVKKLLSLILCVCLISGMFTGCGDKKTVDNDEQVELHWVFGGPGKLDDSDKVWKLFNEKLKEYLPNTTVKFTCIPHADYAQKWRLMSAAQEDVDIVWVSYAQSFQDEVAKRSYMDITELIDKYGQDMKAGFPDWLLDLTTINGKIYAIPNYQMMTSPSGFSIEKTHVDNGWLDLEKAEAVFANGRTLHKDDFKIFEDYIESVQASGEKVKYISNQFITRGLKQIGLPRTGYGYNPVICNAICRKEGDGYKVYDKLTDFPESYDYYDLVSEWYKKGYIRPDILENPSEKEGDYLLWWTSVFKGSEERVSLKRGIPMKIFSSDSKLYIGNTGSATNTAIAANSKHPERAMQLLNIMNSEKGAELLNLLCYGIEGEHYKKVSDDRIEWLGNGVPGASNNKYGYENWALGNALVTYTTQHDPEGWNEYIHEEINMKAEMSDLAGFSFDPKPVKLEISQYQTVEKEYAYLDKGTTPNYKEVLKERNAKFEEAGSKKIIAEVQRQLDEWVKNK